MPSPLDFIQTLSQKVLAGSKNELGAKSSIDESNSPKADAFSSAFNQALRTKLNKAEKSSPNRTEKAADAANKPTVERTIEKTTANKPDQKDNIDPKTDKTNKKAEEETTVEIAMAEGLTTQQPLSNEPEPSSEDAGFSSIQTEESSTVGEPEGKTKLEEKTELTEATTPLAQSVSFSTLSSEALIMMGLPAEFQVQNTQNSFTPTTNADPDGSPQSIMDIEASNLPTDLSAPLNNAMNLIQTNFGLPQPLPIPGNNQGPGFEEALQSALPDLTQTQVENLAPSNATTEIPLEALELPNGPDPNEFNPMLNQTNLPNNFLTPNTPQNTTTQIIETTTSPLTTSLPEMAQNTPELATAFSLPTQEIAPAGQGLPDPFSLSSPEMAEEALAVSTPLGSRPKENAASTKPPMDELLKPITDLQQSLSALNGEIESMTQGPDPDLESSEAFSEESLPDRSEQAGSSSDPLAPMPFSANLAAPAGIAENTAANASGKLPQFASLTQNPVDQVVDGTVYSVKNGHKELILKINPDNLGEVRIRLTSHGNNEMSARLIASTNEGHELLKTQAETLKASLEAQGIRIDKLSVMLAGQTDNGANPNKQDQASDFQQQSSNQSQTQQQAFQQSNQSFNPFFQANNGAYQNKQGFAQSPGSMNNGTGHGTEESSSRSAEPVSRRNDDGHVSVLA